MAFGESDNILWHLVAGTRGGPNRLQILYALSEEPQNANQLAKTTGLDYKTIRHHLEILVENGLVRASQETRYGELYYLTEFAKEKLKVFDAIWKKFEKNDLGKG